MNEGEIIQKISPENRSIESRRLKRMSGSETKTGSSIIGAITSGKNGFNCFTLIPAGEIPKMLSCSLILRRKYNIIREASPEQIPIADYLILPHGCNALVPEFSHSRRCIQRRHCQNYKQRVSVKSPAVRSESKSNTFLTSR
jgi:hypothetical protein